MKLSPYQHISPRRKLHSEGLNFQSSLGSRASDISHGLHSKTVWSHCCAQTDVTLSNGPPNSGDFEAGKPVATCLHFYEPLCDLEKMLPDANMSGFPSIMHQRTDLVTFHSTICTGQNSYLKVEARLKCTCTVLGRRIMNVITMIYA